MQTSWGNFWQRSRKPLKTGWLIAAGLMAVYIGAIQPRQRAQGWAPLSLKRRATPYDQTTEGVVGGVPGGVADKEVSLEAASVSGVPAPPPPPPESAPDDRKTIRNGAMDLIVKNPRDSSEAIRQLAERVGGFLVSSEISGEEDASSASLTIRVPAARFEKARGEIRKLGLRVDSEKLDAEDVTRQYVDQSARLRNLHAQETQYLGILKQAKTVEDNAQSQR
jgi:hypothetical protein